MIDRPNSLSAFLFGALGVFLLGVSWASAGPDRSVEILLRNLESIQSDPSQRQPIMDRIAEEIEAAEGELRTLDQSIADLREALSRFEQDRAGLRGLPVHAPEGGDATDEEWWAFQPLAKPDVPSASDAGWSLNPIDRFVFSRLSKNGLRPAPQASPAALARRLYFDLIGLPPTPEELEAFLDDTSSDSWEKLIDRLLADPRYGEHWAQFWLDLVRYSESDGWKADAYRPHIWRYRDYVVDSFNNDKPYPEFVREQLAGDEIPGDDPEDRIATGFLRLGIYEYNQRDARSHWNDIMNEMTDVAGDVFLGLSMSCCRCHDHKFDPIPQTDYFALRAFFEPVLWRDDLLAATEKERAVWRAEQDRWEEATAEIRAEIDTLCRPYFEKKRNERVDTFPIEIQACFNKPVEERNSWEQQMAYLVERQSVEEGESALAGMKEEEKERLAKLEERLAEFDNLKPNPLPAVMSVSDFEGRISPTVLPKDRNKTPIPPKFLTVLSSFTLQDEPSRPDLAQVAGRRAALAEWIAKDDNPLTTRLIVNRIWQQHFGRGIAPTASDFGRLGKPPTHPELLDWLTVTFLENGWSMKRLHKLILTSSTWRQSSNHPEAFSQLEKDPEEIGMWRARTRRLKAEEIRDAMLQITGELDFCVGGPSVEADTPRRALYVKKFRNSPNPLLAGFDAANGLTSVAQRNLTTTPTQALLLFNGEFALARSKRFADRVKELERENPAEALDYAFRLAWGRAPSDDELSRATSYVASPSDGKLSGWDNERLADFCHVLLNSNEFLYVD